MVGQPKSEGVRHRYSEYVGELQDFFSSRGVPYGKPEDLGTFAQHLAEDDSFQEEMGSMVRSVMYQADERLGRGELLELVTLAVGGADVDVATGDLQTAIRQIFLFLNAAVRQGHMSMAETTPAAEDSPGLAKPIPSAAPAAPLPPKVAAPENTEAASTVIPQRREPSAGGRRAVWPPSGHVPTTPPVDAGTAPAVTQPSPQATMEPQRRAPSNEVLFRAMSLAAEDERVPAFTPAPALMREEPDDSSRVPWWAIPAVGLVLAALGAGMYVGRPLVDRHVQAISQGKDAVQASDPGQAAGAVASSCVAPLASGVTRSGVEERSRWAHKLLDQRLYEAALPELREIARLDPGYPGIKLDESDALLNMKRPDDAREAVDAQISISECLARLPSATLDTYCSAQFSIASVAGCRAQLTHIRQAAEIQAALVHLELGHRVQPDADAAAAIAELTSPKAAKAEKPAHTAAPAPALREREVEPLPPATEGDAAQPPMPRETTSRTSGKRAKGDASLVQGDGTDSAYGAYQKPQ